MAFRRRNKSYPFFSQEFLIQNHADIVLCLVVFILLGLMFETTSKTAFVFILPQYNSSTFTPEGEVSLYRYGWRDCTTTFFYFLIAIILHAVVQEYILDRANRRLRLSKSKNTKFNESGQLCVFHLLSSAWTFYILITEGYLLNISSLWENYPHVYLRFQVKFYYLSQLAFWLHALPELYFQKIRKEDVPRRLQYISLYLLHILMAYLLNLTRVGLLLMFLQHLSEMGFHASRLLYLTDESHHRLFDMWAVGFVFTRMVTLTLLFLVLGFGLARVENQSLDWEAGNFNTVLVRLTALSIVCLTQIWQLWKFIRFQLRRRRQEQAARKRPAGQQPPRVARKDAGGQYNNGAVKAENGASPRPKKIKVL
ncbi:translocating chain-associated membrane protein 2-like isoform X1 [Paramormyrops kingsleyae]|uniref:translocating chain-associated membrane protein 2-like isoform X1 n=1 Tax=Paramormyrops kingsleyae TaxID=1676925 RepID=UPI003B971D23